MEISEPTQCDSHPGAIKTFENWYTQDQQTLKAEILSKFTLDRWLLLFLIKSEGQ